MGSCNERHEVNEIDVEIAIPYVESTVEYPCDNDDPMAETRERYCALAYAVNAIEKHLHRDTGRRWEDLSTGDFSLYYEEGNPKA